MRNRVSIAMTILLLLSITSCKREERQLRPDPNASQTLNTVQVSGLNPGANSISSPPPAGQYEESAYAVSQGKTLYNQYNCVGCHANGGGGIGPPLMDNNWIYGSEPQNIFTTIVEGRPNGMPSFRGKIQDPQVWQIVAYVRSMSGQLSSLVAPGRTDDMNAQKPEQSKGKEQPKSETRPGSAPPPP